MNKIDFMMKNAVPGGRVTPIDYPANAAARFGQFAPTPKVYRIDLGTARDKDKQGIGGSFIWAYRASDTGAEVDMQFNSQQADKVNFTLGTSIGGLQFSEIFISHDAQAGKWVEFFVLTEGAELRVMNPANVFQSVTLTKADTIGTVADVTVTAAAAAAIVLAADSARRIATIQAYSGNTQVVRIGDSNTGAARGVVLSPGDSIDIASTDNVYAYTGAGADQTLQIMYTED